MRAERGAHSLHLAVLALLVAVAAYSAAPATNDSLTPEMTTTEAPLSASKLQALRLGREKLKYNASFIERELKNDAGVVEATISATTYVRAGLKDAGSRPVLFAFNGGPGASSSPLHFGALGPRKWSEGDRATREIVPNDQSLIDAADLVFIDPVGTGFSRLRPGAEPANYWSRAGDAKSVVTFIKTWLKDNAREASPVFIAGESYGGFRLATAAPDLADLNLVGLIFISPLLDASATSGGEGNDLPYIFELPTLAAGAWHHQKIDRAGRTVEQHFEAAAKFAQSDYAAALLQGNTLSATERTRIARVMSALIGLPVEVIEAANLRIDSEQFLATLLADQKLLVGRLDMRVTAPQPEKKSDRPPGADDPALGMKGSNVIKSTGIKEYLAREIGVNTQRDYLSLSLDVNFRWDWRGPKWPPEFYVNPTMRVAELLEKKPSAGVLLVGGYYDLAVPVLASRYAFAHSNLPQDRVKFATFISGHSPFEGGDNLARFAATVRDFLRSHTVPVQSVKANQ